MNESKNVIEVNVGLDGKGETRIEGMPSEVLPAIANGLGHIFAHFEKVTPLKDLLKMSVAKTCDEPFMLQVSEGNTGFGGCEECLLSAIADVIRGVASSMGLDDADAKELYVTIYADAVNISKISANQEPTEINFGDMPEDIKEKMGFTTD